MEEDRRDDAGISGDDVRLADGSVFSIGGVKSTLSRMVDADKITGESVVFSIGPADAPVEAGPTLEEAASEDASVLRAHITDERYRISREIARGGMGSILLAEDADLRRYVAMKVLIEPGDVSSGMCERFVKEAQVTGFLEHPNIVPVHELGVDERARPFFTMKLIEGESFGAVLDKLRNDDTTYRNEYPLRRMLGIFVQICNAIEFAHSKGVIHRDLKPDNVMIGCHGEVLVMDWGLSKIRNFEEILAPYNVADPENFNQTQEGTVIGTPPYMPPEQATGRIDETDERSDIFSLGAILYEIITGVRLYQGASVGEIMSKAIATKFQLPSKISKVPADLERICVKALHESKDERYRSVAELSEQIRAYLDHRVIPEYTITTWRKLLQSLGVVAFLAFLVPVVNFTGIDFLLAILNIPSAIFVLGIAVCFQIIVVGWRISFFGKFRRQVDPVGVTQGSIIMQEGAFCGGLLGFLLGYLALLGNIDVPEALGSNMSLAVITTLYFYVFYIIFRLDTIRELRKNSLFDAIAENSYAHLFRYVTLLVLPVATFFIIFDLKLPDNLFQENRFFLYPGYVPLYPALLYMLCLSFTFVYCRFVFTFKEMIAAMEHAMAFLADNVVSRENRVHAAAVIRMLTETFLLTISASIVLFEINMLSNLASEREIIPAFTTLVIVGIVPLLIYILVNFIFIPRFLGYRGAARDRRQTAERLAAWYRQSCGSFWSAGRRGAAVLVFAHIGFVALGVFALVTSGAIWSIHVGFGNAIGGSVLIYANVRRLLLKRIYRSSFDKPAD